MGPWQEEGDYFELKYLTIQSKTTSMHEPNDSSNPNRTLMRDDSTVVVIINK